MADWVDIFNKINKALVIVGKYISDQQDRVVDSFANTSPENFKRVYDNRTNKGEATRKIIEEAAKKRNWKG